MVALCMAARLTVVQCFGSRASVIFSMMETVARRNAKQGSQSSLEEVWLAKDLLGDVRSLWLLFLHYFRRLVLRCSLSWCRTQVSWCFVVSIQRRQCERATLWIVEPNPKETTQQRNDFVVPSPKSDTKHVQRRPLSVFAWRTCRETSLPSRDVR